jgi:predicted lipoprotein with Yx(FWY)xxD motif
MKTIAFGVVGLLIGTAAALADEPPVALTDEPAKAMDSSAGKVYTDANGMTLYTFDKDAEGKSNCDGDCAVAWPPFKAAADAKGEGEWSIVDRNDGSKMWAYEGKPLYTYVDDKKAGDVTGDGKGGVWHAAKAD